MNLPMSGGHGWGSGLRPDLVTGDPCLVLLLSVLKFDGFINWLKSVVITM